MIARVMCVHLSPPFNKSSVAPSDGDGQGSTSKLVNNTEVISMDAGNNRTSNDSRDLGNKVDDLLFELRKVGRLCFFYDSNQYSQFCLKFYSPVNCLNGASNFKLFKHILQY